MFQDRDNHSLCELVRLQTLAVAMLDRQMCYLSASDRWLAYFHQDICQIIGKNHCQLLPHIPPFWQQEGSFSNFHADYSPETIARTTENGDVLVNNLGDDNIDWQVYPWYDFQGDMGGLLIVAQTDTEKQLLQAKIASCELQMRVIFAGMEQLVFTLDLDNQELLFLQTKFFELYEDTIVNQIVEKTYESIYDDSNGEYQSVVQQVLSTQSAQDFDYCLSSGDLRWWFQATISHISATSVIVVAQNISERKEAEQDRQFIERELAQITLQSIGDGIIIADVVGKIEYINPIAEELTGWSLAEAQGMFLTDVFQLIDETTQQKILNPLDIISFPKKNKIELATNNFLVNRHQKKYAIEGSVSPLKNRHGKLGRVVAVFRDVTETRKIAQQLSWQATHDPLTQLCNRREFEEQLKLSLDRVFNSQDKDRIQDRFNCVLGYIDLDRFKIVNDLCGHNAGDKLLKQIVRLLQQRIRASDIFARLGGDEFGILFCRCSIEQALEISQQLVEIIENFRFIWEDKILRIGVSIGLVAMSSEVKTVTELIHQADTACYMAKQAGGNCVRLTNRESLVQQKGEERLLQNIHRALDENRFCLYAQKIVPLDPHSNCVHYEILLRLLDDRGKLIAPGAFLPLAEKSGLMPAIDRWVVATFLAGYESFCQARDLQANLPVTTIENHRLYTINLSGASINNQEFGNFLQQQFQTYNVPPETICFEITETVAISNLNDAVVFIEKLKQLGCKIALDDFGSGMSSFNYLKHLPIDYLKIDGGFVKNIVRDEFDCATVECFSHISNIMQIKTIAEFVENHDIFNKLQQIGINYAQGYGIEEPQPLVW